MKIRCLTSAREVVETIGIARLIELTGRGPQHVSNWKSTGYFPPAFILIMRVELRRHRCRAPASLWRVVEPKEMARAS